MHFSYLKFCFLLGELYEVVGMAGYFVVLVKGFDFPHGLNEMVVLDLNLFNVVLPSL